MERTVSDHVSDPRHSAALDGADAIGEAWGGNRLLVRVGVWHDPDGRVLRARYRSSTCASLIAFAEVACDLLERGAASDAADPGALAARVRGVHPTHLDRAGLVSAAVRAALPPQPEVSA